MGFVLEFAFIKLDPLFIIKIEKHQEDSQLNGAIDFFELYCNHYSKHGTSSLNSVFKQFLFHAIYMNNGDSISEVIIPRMEKIL